MRDLLIAAIVFGALPFILKRPFWGVLMLAWLGYMNPHRLCYGFMLTMPVVMIVAAVTLIGMLNSKEDKRMVWSREIFVLIGFVIWMGITTTQAFYFDSAYEQYIKFIKIQILTVMTLLLLTSRERVHLFIWVLVLALGFYGVKGGIFTVLRGGVYRVQGPYGSFIEGNNELALALIMTIPLIRYLHLQEQNKLIKSALAVGMLLTAIAAVGTQSRGALVGLSCMAVLFWLKGRNKLAGAVFVGGAIIIAAAVMPAEWYERMGTIKTYDEDASAMGRINAWWTAWNVATARLFGGGFEMWRTAVFYQYAPVRSDVRDAHSLYFKVLGEHGFIGLFFFLLLLLLTWRKCSAIVRLGNTQPDAGWARDLGAMIQVSIVGYMAAGTFLGMAYFDYIYHLIAVVVVVHQLLVSPRDAPLGASVAARSPTRPLPEPRPLR